LVDKFNSSSTSKAAYMDGVCSTNDKDDMNTKFSLEYLKGGYVEAVEVDGRVNYSGSLRNIVGGRGLDLSGSGYGLMAMTCKDTNEPSSSITGKAFLDYLSDY
jgi:hypothetical protein